MMEGQGERRKGARCEEQMAGRRQRVGETVTLMENTHEGWTSARETNVVCSVIKLRRRVRGLELQSCAARRVSLPRLVAPRLQFITGCAGVNTQTSLGLQRQSAI